MNKRHLNTLKPRVLSCALCLNKYSPIIKEVSTKYNLDPNLLYGFIVLEAFNRGHWFSRLLEKVSAKLFPKIIIRLDVSIGLAQIRISTAKSINKTLNDERILSILLDDKSNIECCGKLLRSYLDKIRRLPLPYSCTHYLVNLYLSGELNCPKNPSIKMYEELLLWLLEIKIFSMSEPSDDTQDQ